MNRIMVIGCCGAGKSTFSKKLGQLTNLEVIHLDQYYWKPNWTESTPVEWRKTVEKLAEKPQWVMDGNYGGTMDLRIPKADTIIYLDYPTLKCLWRITQRTLKYKGQNRPDMPEGCHERFDLEFYHYVATYNLVRRKKLLEIINSFKKEKQIFVFKNDQETDAYLQGLVAKK